MKHKRLVATVSLSKMEAKKVPAEAEKGSVGVKSNLNPDPRFYARPCIKPKTACAHQQREGLVVLGVVGVLARAAAQRAALAHLEGMCDGHVCLLMSSCRRSSPRQLCTSTKQSAADSVVHSVYSKVHLQPAPTRPPTCTTT